MTLCLITSEPDSGSVDASEPPAGLKVDVRDLRPRRAYLARLVAWRKALQDELDLLASGRCDLADHIERLDRERAAAAEAALQSAENVLARIRQGLGWNIVSQKAAPDYSAELAIAKTALEKLDGEIATKQSTLDGLASRVVAVWSSLMATWQRDPRAEPDLIFPPHDPDQVEMLIYHELSETERRIVDAEFVNQAKG
jgi:hypothetical protein